VYETENLKCGISCSTLDARTDFPAPEGPETIIRFPLRAISLNVLNLLAKLFDIRFDGDGAARHFQIPGLG
jgi:hypothetical protein